MASKELHNERSFLLKELIFIKNDAVFFLQFSIAPSFRYLNDYFSKMFNAGFKKRVYHLTNAEPSRYKSKENPLKWNSLFVFATIQRSINN
jgi:hypothetical protein